MERPLTLQTRPLAPPWPTALLSSRVPPCLRGIIETIGHARMRLFAKLIWGAVSGGLTHRPERCGTSVAALYCPKQTPRKRCPASRPNRPMSIRRPIVELPERIVPGFAWRCIYQSKANTMTNAKKARGCSSLTAACDSTRKRQGPPRRKSFI